MKSVTALLCAASLALAAVPATANQAAPWGRAAPPHASYAPQKVVYDVSVNSTRALGGVFDRLGFLNTLYEANPFDAHIVVVLHGNEIPMFAIKNLGQYREQMVRAVSLTQAGPIEFRMCAAAARLHGLAPEDIHGFVRMVPMADAELIKLQREDGYAYMR